MALIVLPLLFLWLSHFHISTSLWNLSAVPWYCDQQCYRRLRKAETSNAGCLERGKNCLRWDEVNSTFRSTDFGSHFGPSIRHASTTLSTGMHSLENYCRNPDDWHMGPWCFVMVESRIRREACFKQCEAYNHPEFCLAKMFFPYMLPSLSLFNGAPNVETKDESIKDLSDIIDVLNVVRIDSQIRPMFIPTYFNDYIRNYPGDISTRLRCYQTGPQTRIAGPWTYSDVDDPIPERRHWLSDLFKDLDADSMDRERTFRGDGGPRFTHWRPCFLACEDNNIPCWPVAQVGPTRRRFPYYGPRDYNIHGERCVSPFFAYEILLHRKELAKLTNDEKIYLKIFRDEILYDRNKRPRIRNIFAYSKGRLMISNRCFTLGDFLRGMDKSARIIMAEQYSLYRRIFTIGAGCFTEVEYRKKVEYQRCFIDCPCNRTLYEPAIFEENRHGLEGSETRIVEENDDYSEDAGTLQNITGIGQVKPSSNVMLASLLLLGIALSCFVLAILIVVLNEDQ
ncbi:unnamed protein product [Litomosoides sigmodontis]|uniref:Kringle domain-containing protein n=1 Tax=Litomosoides sigmodontis TaxID=42156 RepID=A0A3P6TDB7_LITSI|nr:unnamed protein product [Litomosoides sigmodontis]